MRALRKLSLAIILILLASFLAAAQEDAGIPAESQEYESYTSCVSGCAQCELRCKDSAIQQYAENVNDVSFCEKLSNEALKNFCSDNINSAKAIVAKDPTKCSLIKDEDLRSSCQNVISLQKAIESGNAGSCAGNQACVNAVNLHLALSKKDDSYCQKITDSQQRRECNDGLQDITGEKSNEKIKVNFPLILGILGGMVLLALLSLVIYFLIKRKPRQEEAPLLFKQQTQPSQLAMGMGQQKPQTPQQPNLDLNKLQEALKKVGK